MGTVREPGARQKIRITLPQQATEDIENTTQSVGAAGQGRRLLGLQQGAMGNTHLHQVIEAVVEHDLGVEDHDHVHAAEHLEHFFVQVEVDGTDRLGIRTLKIKDDLIPFPPHGALDAVGPHTQAVIANIVLEELLFLRHRGLDQLAHGALVAIQQLVQGRVENVITKTSGHLNHALFRRADGSHQGVEVTSVPVGHAAVVKNQFQQIRLQLVTLVNLGWRDADALLKNFPGVGGQTARHLAANVGHVAEHGGIGNQPTVLEDRPQQQPVVDVADGAITGVGIGGKKQIPLFDGAVVGLFETVDEAAELPHHHLALQVSDHGEFIMLFPDARGHGRAEQYRVHLVAGIHHGIFNNVQRDGIHINALKLFAVGLYYGRRH